MKFTKKDFIETASLIKKMPKSKRFAEFEKWVEKFTDINPLFDKERFANSCGFKWVDSQSEYRPIERGETIKPTHKSNVRKVVSSEKIVTDFNSFNSIQNRYDLKCVDKNMKYPTGLLAAAIKDFEEWCKTYHVDHTKFKYIRITGNDITWQVDFHDDLNPTGVHVSMWEIYYWNKKKTIMQRCISIN